MGELQPVDLCTALGLRASEAQLQALDGYQQLLLQWNGTYNLTAVRDPADMRVQHLADCLAVVPSLLARGLAGGRALDVGSGAGLPGVVLAIMLADLDVSCVDAVGKKAAFVRQVAATLNLQNLHAHHCRVQDLRAQPYDLITSRAFSSLHQFCKATHAHLKPEGVWMAMKGKVPTEEMDQVRALNNPPVQVFHVEQLTVPGLAAERCLVWMKKRPSP